MPTIWFDSLLSEAVAPGTQDLRQLGTGAQAVTERRLQRYTLTRTIIGLEIHPTVRDSGEGDQLVDIGIGLFSLEANTAAEVANPAVESEFPIQGWLWRARYRVYASAVDDQNIYPVRIDLDIRAQRKLENGRMGLVTSNMNNQGTSTAISVTGIIRMLYIVG